MTRPGLCLDAMGTLIEMTRPVGEVYHDVARAFGVDLPAWRLEDAFQRVLRRAPPREALGSTRAERCDRELEWWSERVRQTFQATDSTARFEDLPGFARALFDTYRQASLWRARPEVVPTLRRLHREGMPMAVLSNFDHRLPEILESIGLITFFEDVLIPSECGLHKPSSALFELASDRLGVPLEALVYVGDDSPEILAAISDLGVRVIDVDQLAGFARLPDRIALPATLPAEPPDGRSALTPPKLRS